jgi:NAD(P)-dependent dehydrogenase (short-subunit alcohol dehydrogenase family)
MKDVKGKVAVVTGAASGIGRGMCETFVQAGMRVVLSDVEEKALALTTAGLRDDGADVHAVVTDVSKAEQVDALAKETLRKYGAVHVVCNNAGVGASGFPSWTSTLDDWRWVLVNLMGVIHGVRTFLPIMIDRDTEGTSSTPSLAGLLSGGGTVYSVTRFGVVALSEACTWSCGRAAKPGISVLCPGFVNTNILKAERNRPADLPDASPAPTGPVVDVFREWFEEQLRSGMSPRRVGEIVLDAIREDRFYILPHPEAAPAIEHRTRQIVAGENPVPLPPPEFETFLQRLAAVQERRSRCPADPAVGAGELDPQDRPCARHAPLTFWLQPSAPAQ